MPDMEAPNLPPPSRVRQNYHPSCENTVNNLINLELHASYVYLSMAFYFERDDVALKHFAQFFLRLSHKEREQAQKLMGLQVQRGGRLHLRTIAGPEHQDWGGGLPAMEGAFHLAKSLNHRLLELQWLASDKSDAHLCDFLEEHYLNHQVETVKELSGHVTSLRKMGAPETGLAQYLFDKLTLGPSREEN